MPEDLENLSQNLIQLLIKKRDYFYQALASTQQQGKVLLSQTDELDRQVEQKGELLDQVKLVDAEIAQIMASITSLNKASGFSVGLLPSLQALQYDKLIKDIRLALEEIMELDKTNISQLEKRVGELKKDMGGVQNTKRLGQYSAYKEYGKTGTIDPNFIDKKK